MASIYDLKQYAGAIFHAPWPILVARIGYVAGGTVYAIIGAFAILAAIGAGGRTVGSKGALIGLLSEPAGRLLLALVAAGLACFGVWRGLQAFVDADHRGLGIKAGVQRAIYAGAALVNFGLAFWAASIAVSSSPTARGEDKTVHDWTAWLMHFPFGRWLVVFIGIGVVIGAIGIGLKAFSEKSAVRLLPQAPDWVILVGRIGFLTRSLVFLLIGVFLVGAGVNVSSSEAKGLAGALRSLEQQSYGSFLLGLTGAGLVAFAVFEAVQARWRKIEVPRTKGLPS